jgi:predicted transcriptional regulator of viral defense system
VTAATIARMKEKGALLRLNRGLYQLPDAPLAGSPEHRGAAQELSQPRPRPGSESASRQGA